jgi:uncharacterized Tic20 family protein
MTEEQTSQMSTQDARVMAGISHISALIPMMGLFAPIIIWVTQKDKSEYVAFQSLQALAYQLAMIVGYIIWMGCYMVSIFGTVFTMAIVAPESSAEASNSLAMGFAFLPFLFMCVFFLLGFLMIVYGVVGAVQAFQGKPFRYLLIGRWVERYLTGKADKDSPAEA